MENAVKHGVAPHIGPGFVRISISARGSAVAVEVSTPAKVRLAQPQYGIRGRFDQRSPPVELR